MGYDDFGDREAAQENPGQATTAVELKDFRGTPITVGSVIVYPGRQSSSLWMTEAVVEEIITRTSWNDREVPALRVRPTLTTGYPEIPDSGGKIVVIEQVGRIVVVPPREGA